MTLKAIDCMGFAGGFALGVTQAGFDVVHKVEPAVFTGFGVPQVEVNMPGVTIDVTEPELWSIVKADMVFGNPECFAAGTIVITERGTIPIEDIVVGDTALTRQGRWRKVAPSCLIQKCANV